MPRLSSCGHVRQIRHLAPLGATNGQTLCEEGIWLNQAGSNAKGRHLQTASRLFPVELPTQRSHALPNVSQLSSSGAGASRH